MFMKKIYFLMMMLFFTVLSFAADRYWVGGAAGNWNSAANWSATTGGAGGASVPGANDKPIFDNGLSVSVTYDLANNDVGFSDFSIRNNTQLTLTNSVNATRSLTINNSGTTYYEVVAVGSSLTLQSNTNTVFNFGSGTLSNGRMIFNGNVRCINQAINTSNGPRLNSQDSIIINALFYVGPSISSTGSNPTGTNRYRFSTGSVYQIDKNGGVIPGGKWESGSLIRVTGTTTAFPSTWQTAAAYGGIEFNAPTANGGITNLSIPSNAVFQGDFNVVSLGTSSGIRFATTPTNITIQGNLSIQNGAVSLANSATAGSITVNGNFSQSAATTLDLQSSSASTILNIKGNFNTLGTVTENGTSTASTIILNGTTNQSLSFGTITNDVRFQMNNTAGATVTSNWTIPNSTNSRLTLTNGIINMGTNLLTIQNPGTLSLAGGSVASHIIGRLRRATNVIATYVFPVSTNATENPMARITPLGTTPTEYEVQFFKPNTFDRLAVPTGIANAANYYWDITRPVGTENADINFFYGELANNGGGITNTAAVRGLHWNGTSWDNFGGTDAGGNSVDVTGVSIFSPFSLGSTLEILPVMFGNIKAYQQGSGIKIEWSNLTEIDVNSYTVERSADGINFSSIATARATKNDGGKVDYNSFDASPLGGNNYYRIKSLENDGKTLRSMVVKVSVKDGGNIEISVYPNPVADGNLSLQATLLPKGQYTINIFGANGQQVQRKVFNHQGGSSTEVITLPAGLKGGMYSIHLSGADVKLSKTFIVRQ
jgi:hypothetical protein